MKPGELDDCVSGIRQHCRMVTFQTAEEEKKIRAGNIGDGFHSCCVHEGRNEPVCKSSRSLARSNMVAAAKVYRRNGHDWNS